MPSLDQLAIEMCVSFAVNQLATHGASVNWAQAQAQADTYLKGVIHETWLEGDAEAMAAAVLDAAQVVCQSSDSVKAIIDAVAGGDVTTAVKDLKALIVQVLPKNGEFTPELTQLLQAA